MEGNLTSSPQVEDEGKPIQAQTGNPGISSQAKEGNPSLMVAGERENSLHTSPRPEKGRTCVRADEGNATVLPEAADGFILSAADNVRTSISAPADLNSALSEHVQETEKIQENATIVTVHSSTTLVASSTDVSMSDRCQEGKPGEHSEHADAGMAFGGPNLGTHACDNHNDEFLPIDDINEDIMPNRRTDFDDGGSGPVQDDLPWTEGSIDNRDSVSESPDGNRRLSLKRCRSSCIDNTPCVQVIYRCLTRDSKNKLKELLQQWAQWHGEFVGMEENAVSGSLDSGDETYFPPLQVRGVSNSTVSFWMDKPSKQARTENAASDSTPVSQDREKEVPLYDRAETGALISQEIEMSLEGGLECVEGSRCFNCGSYSHSLKDCPRPRDNVAISNARKLLADKRGSANGSRSASRYYQSSPGGKFDDLKPGVLGSETRQLLGIGEHDPPPWLNRMRELGYPPGYLEDQEEEQSGITIFGTNEDAEGNFIGEDGEIVGGNKTKRSIAKKMKVHFPGVNAPIPHDADRHIWGSPADTSTHDRPSQRAGGRSSHADTAAHVGLEDWEGPPGVPRDNYGRNSKTRSPGFEGSLLSRTPPWQPVEQSRLGRAPPPSPRSPHLGRSASDSGRRSPKVAYDEPHSLPPLGYYSGSRLSPLHSVRSYHSPSTPNPRFPQRPDSRDEESRRRVWAVAQDALQSMHPRNDRYSPARRR